MLLMVRLNTIWCPKRNIETSTMVQRHSVFHQQVSASMAHMQDAAHLPQISKFFTF